jgi:hypothetical protein
MHFRIKFKTLLIVAAMVAALCVIIGVLVRLSVVAVNQAHESAASERELELADWVQLVGRPDYKELYATTVQGRHIAIFDAGNDTIAFCDSQSDLDPGVTLTIRNSSGESAFDHSRKHAPLTLSYRSRFVTTQRDVGMLVPIRHHEKGESLLFLYERLSEEKDGLHAHSGSPNPVILRVELRVN